MSTALLLGIAGGLACGTKGLSVVLVGPILAVAGLLLLRDLIARPVGRNARGRTVARLAALVVPILVIGASWYLKNLVVYGNPVYPFAFGPFHGPTTLANVAMNIPSLTGHSLISQLATSWTADWHITRYAYNVRPGGLGRAWLVILVIAVGGFVLLVRRRQLDAIALVIAPATFLLLTMPMPWYARYTLFLVAIALPLAALALSSIRPSFATVAGLALVGLAAISLAFVNIRPNINLRPAVATAGFRDYLGLVFDADDSRRSNVDLRAACAGFGVVPPGRGWCRAGSTCYMRLPGRTLTGSSRSRSGRPPDQKSSPARCGRKAPSGWRQVALGGSMSWLRRRRTCSSATVRCVGVHDSGSSRPAVADDAPRPGVGPRSHDRTARLPRSAPLAAGRRGPRARRPVTAPAPRTPGARDRSGRPFEGSRAAAAP